MAVTAQEAIKIENNIAFEKLDSITTVDEFLNKCNSKNKKHSQNKLYRLFDIIFSVMVLILLSPVYLAIGFLIKIKSPGAPAFYGHKRVGLNGEEFNCYKFRTMVHDADKKLEELFAIDPEARVEYEKDFKLKNDPRVIPGIGVLLRRTSLDELPQFYNALVGDMSIVGPRPIVEDEKVKYGKCIDTLLSVKPGITGLWQVSGRNDLSYETRVLLDVKYIYNKNLLLDVHLIFKTLRVMINKQGAY